MSGHVNERWVDLYKLALLELERALVTGRIADARDGVRRRVEELKRFPGLHSEECAAIEDPLLSLRSLEAEESHLAKDDKRRAFEQAFRDLQSVAPKIQAPEKRD